MYSQRSDATGAVEPVSTAPVLSSAALVAVNLLPLYAVWVGWLSVGDVFVAYWVENVVVWGVTIVKVATAQGTQPLRRNVTFNDRPINGMGSVALAAFFSVHFGIFTIVHGVFTLFLAMSLGGFDLGNAILVALGFLGSHLVSLAFNWFGQGERTALSSAQVMVQPYPRMVVLHVSIIASFFLVIRSQVDGDVSQAGGAAFAVLLLCGLKTALDLWFHLRERRRARDAVVTV